MSIEVDLDQIKKKFKEKQEAAQKAKSGKRKSAKDSLILKVEEAGKLNFRAVPYPHSSNPVGDPFPVRSYHFLPVGTYYCPKLNDNDDCYVCDFVWKQMKQNKGNAQTVNKWKEYLPTTYVFVAGLARGRETEGPKFLRIKTYGKEMSKRHVKLFEWFTEDEINWIDPHEGRDLKLEYEEMDEKTSKYLGGAKYKLADIDLSKKETPFSADNPDEDFDDFLNKVPNIDEDVYSTHTTQDTLEALEKWKKKLNLSNDTRKDDSGEMNVSANEKDETKKEESVEDSDNDELDDLKQALGELDDEDDDE